MSDPVFDLSSHPVHLGLGATIEVLPKFTGDMEWYQNYGKAVAEKDGKEGRLVTIHTFESDWGTWEVHPEGTELVYVISGDMTLVQDVDGVLKEVRMVAGQAAINPPGVWHTARVQEKTTALFITAGLGTKNEVR